MKKKIVGIFVCMLMLASIPLVVGTTGESESSELQVVTITRPAASTIYLFDIPLFSRPAGPPIIIGPITCQATGQPQVAAVSWWATLWWGFNIDGPVVTTPPYSWFVNNLNFGKFIIHAEARDAAGNPIGTHSLNTYKFF